MAKVHFELGKQCSKERSSRCRVPISQESRKEAKASDWLPAGG